MAHIDVKITKLLSGDYRVEKTETALLSKTDIDDIMCSALEGGITYWCNKVDVVENEYYGEYAHEQISRGGSLRIHDYEEGESYILTLDGFIKGVALALEDGYGEDWIANGAIDAGQIDAIAADVIVQFAIFGEVIYG